MKRKKSKRRNPTPTVERMIDRLEKLSDEIDAEENRLVSDFVIQDFREQIAEIKASIKEIEKEIKQEIKERLAAVEGEVREEFKEEEEERRAELGAVEKELADDLENNKKVKAKMKELQKQFDILDNEIRSLDPEFTGL